MCGIAGVIHIDKKYITKHSIKTMTDTLIHRGPDGEGHWIGDHIALGHRRLSIIDLTESGAQPMHYLNRYTITFNGEIYNYIELKKQLLVDGYIFTSESDTEVLLALYDKYKEKCLSFLDGMFAFAIWDEVDQSLFCARDRFGEKPFFYSYEPGNYFYFASEIKAIKSAGIKLKVNNKILYNFLSYSSIEDPTNRSNTFYSNINKIKIAHYIKIRFPEIHLEEKEYWSIDPNNKNTAINEKDAAEKILELFTTSVKRRLRSDVPIGTSLSGGLDSSAVALIINSISTQKEFKQNTFSARFPNFLKDESKFIDIVLDTGDFNAYSTFPNDDDLLSYIDNVCYHQEIPFGSASIFAQYEVMKLAKENNVTVLLDGQGADEIFAGYHYFFTIYLNELKKTNIKEFENQLASYKLLHKNNSINPIEWDEGFMAFCRKKFPSFFSLLRSLKYKLNNLDITNIFHPEFKKNYSNTIHNNIKEFDNLDEALRFSTFSGGLEELLRHGDRTSMANSIEVRLPFLYHELVEFTFSLPSNYKINNGWSKYIERVAFEKNLPNQITWRKDKVGFEPPQNKWLLKPEIKKEVIDSVNYLNNEKILNINIDKLISNYTKDNPYLLNFLWRCWILKKCISL